jgi:hypothetical protein
VLIAAGVFVVVRFAIIFGDCNAVVHRSILSPDGTKSLVIFRMECGATVPYSTQAIIAPARRSFSPTKYPAFFIIAGDSDILAKWLGDDAVEVINLLGTKVVRSDQDAGGVRIEYR